MEVFLIILLLLFLLSFYLKNKQYKEGSELQSNVVFKGNFH
jgi:hypothetical protein